MIKDKYSFQIPQLFSKTNLLQMTLAFGEDILSKEFENGITYVSKSGDFSLFMTEYKIYNMFDTYYVLISKDENLNAQLLIFEKDKYEDVVNCLNSNDSIINEDLFLDYNSENILKIFSLSIIYLSNEYKITYDYIQELLKISDKFTDYNSKEIADSIDEQLGCIDGFNPDWSYSDGAYTYYMYNNLENIFALCKKAGKETDVLFICEEEYKKLFLNPCSVLFKNYWNMCSSDYYQEIAMYCTTVALMTNRLNSIEFMCNINGFDTNCSKLPLLKNLKFKRLAKRAKIKIKNI